MRSTVPAPTTATNRKAHTLVIIKPTGKIPNVLPGITKCGACAAALEGGVGVGLVVEVFVLTSANTPLTNDVLLGEIFVVIGLPSFDVPERAMVGTKRERAERL